MAYYIKLWDGRSLPLKGEIWADDQVDISSVGTEELIQELKSRPEVQVIEFGTTTLIAVDHRKE